MRKFFISPGNVLPPILKSRYNSNFKTIIRVRFRLLLNKYYTQKNKKQFGVWMDMHHAIVVGRLDAEYIAAKFNLLV